MTRIIEHIAEVSDEYDVLFCDLWGCVHDGVRAFPAAVEALKTWRAEGRRVMILTNSPRPRPSVRRQLERLGVPPECYDDITTSGDAAQTAMVEGAVGRKVWHIGAKEHSSFFTEMAKDTAAEAASLPPIELVPAEAAEGIVCTGPFFEMTETPADYVERFKPLVDRGVKLLCANPDIVVDQGDQRIYCAGALAELYETMGGTSLYFGKPHAPIYDLARRRLQQIGIDAGRIAGIGDGPATDVIGALENGIDAIFVSGGLAAWETRTEEQPEPEALTAYLREKGLDPQYTIGRLR
ncbi:TIGR01459 family HAD-type hydrolase [Haematobacter massiliensis]|uniref:HAD family hydrolase n=2 Tax=Haematobacter massiliensis TaxID=195105 RepID=A0A086YCZ4_9RHOB|nr:TIGR01459 family HAD-type hydrolase [Haematobacter massiliensis]KFI32144.1 HAD family hydrolase [Haematobacter massiliensis]OWJ72738.1 TIGR01459 family HAD-type hydrolase [Haematobacter massiliensis]OWJ85782.1 TIGR01459 family HAD-type hydrolase [Haematobacter massiliensis]QBJ24524.1 TIGR01459 family HAD-type hydrolase [Haematobacter massiliensis]